MQASWVSPRSFRQQLLRNQAQPSRAARPTSTSWALHVDHLRRPASCCAVKARWCLDARYGCKAEVIRLMQEWVQTIGATAGLTSANVQLSTGAIGCPESRLELEVTVDSVADWESFLAQIPAPEHRAWSQRMQGMVVDGSPVWHLYRTLPLMDESPQPSTSTASSSIPNRKKLPAVVPAPNTQLPTLFLPSDLDTGGGLDALLQAEVVRSGGWPPSPSPSAPTPPPASSPVAPDDDDDSEIVLDWKGDPMKINKGDRMPRFL